MATKNPPESFNKACVFGGLGFLGRSIVHQLQERHPHVQITVADLRRPTDELRIAGVEYDEVDITVPEQVVNFMEKRKPEVVIDTIAAPFDAAMPMQKKITVEGTRNLINAAKKSDSVKAFVWTSSGSVVVNEGEEYRYGNEDLPYASKPVDEYGQSKAEAEQIVLNANCKEFKTCAIRVVGIFGPGKDCVLLKGMVDLIAARRTTVQIGDNSQLFDFTFVDNAAIAHVLAAEKLIEEEKGQHDTPESSKVSGNAFFVNNNEPVYLFSFIRAVWAINGHTPPYTIKLGATMAWGLAIFTEWVSWLTGRPSPFDRKRVQHTIYSRYFSMEKAQSRLGYTPKYSLDQGLKLSFPDLVPKEELEKIQNSVRKTK